MSPFWLAGVTILVTVFTTVSGWKEGLARQNEHLGCFQFPISGLAVSSDAVSGATEVKCRRQCLRKKLSSDRPYTYMYKARSSPGKCFCISSKVFFSDKEMALRRQTDSTCNGQSDSGPFFDLWYIGPGARFFSDAPNLLVHLPSPYIYHKGQYNGMVMDLDYNFNVVNGGLIVVWDDVAPLGGLTNATADQASPPRWLLYLGVIHFDASNRVVMQVWGELSSAFTVVLVVKTSSTGQHILMRGRTLAGAEKWAIRKSGTTYSVADTTGGGNVVSVACSSCQDSFNGTVVAVKFTSSNVYINVNGNVASSSAGASARGAVHWLDIQASSTPGDWMQLREVAVFKEALANTDRETVERALAFQHGICIYDSCNPDLHLKFASASASAATVTGLQSGDFSVNVGTVRASTATRPSNIDGYLAGPSAGFELDEEAVHNRSGFSISFWANMQDDICVAQETGGTCDFKLSGGSAIHFHGTSAVSGLAAGMYYFAFRVEQGKQDLIWHRVDSQSVYHRRLVLRDKMILVKQVLKCSASDVGDVEMKFHPLPLDKLFSIVHSKCNDGLSTSTVAVSFSPDPGSYDFDLAPEIMEKYVTISQNGGADYLIHFTEDGSEATCSSPPYVSRIRVRNVGSFRIRAVACKCNVRTAEMDGTYVLRMPRDSGFLVLSEKQSIYKHTNSRRFFDWVAGMQRCFTFFSYHRAATVKLQLVNGDINERGITFSKVLEADHAPNYTYCYTITPDLQRGQYREFVSSVPEPEYWGIGPIWELNNNTNLALGKEAQGSSEWYYSWWDVDFLAAYANDGDLRSRRLDINKYGFISSHSFEPFWKVDLGKDYNVGLIRMWGRDWAYDCWWPQAQFIVDVRGTLAHYRHNRWGVSIQIKGSTDAAFRDCYNLTDRHLPDFWPFQGAYLLRCNNRPVAQEVKITLPMAWNGISSGQWWYWEHLELNEVEVYAADAEVCGDGIRQATEECDDGNVWSNDGCSGVCTVEASFECSGGSLEGRDKCTPFMCFQLCAANGICEDGGPGSAAQWCKYGHDCADCGNRCAGEINPQACNSRFGCNFNAINTWGGTSWLHWTFTPKSYTPAIETYSEQGLHQYVSHPFLSWFDYNRFINRDQHHYDWIRVYLRFGTVARPDSWRWPGVQRHRGHVLSVLRIHWLKNMGRFASRFRMLTYSVHDRGHWRHVMDYNGGTDYTRYWERPEGVVWNGGSEGVTEISSWPKQTSRIYFHPMGLQMGFRMVQFFGAPMPYRQYPGSPVQNWWDTELSPFIMNGGGYTFITAKEHFTHNCLFRGNKAYTRMCGETPGTSCRDVPWTGYFFPRQIEFEVPGLRVNMEFWMEVFSIYMNNQMGRLFTGRVFSKELSIPTKPMDVTAEIITAGSIGLLWQAPNNTGGEGVDYYDIFVGQLAGTWEQVSGSSVRLPYGKSTLGLTSVLNEVDEQGTWHYANALRVFCTLENRFGGDTRGTIYGLKANSTYRFRVQSTNRLSRCLPGGNFKLTTSLSVKATTLLSSLPSEPLLSVISKSGGAVTVNIESPNDTGGVPILSYESLIMIPESAASLFIETNDDVNECAQPATHTCHALQACRNTFLSYECSPCPPWHLEEPAHTCVDKTNTPVVYNATLVATLDDTHVSVAASFLNAPVECHYKQVRAFKNETWMEDIENGTTLSGWYSHPGVQLFVQHIPMYGAVFGGNEVLSGGNWLTKIYDLPEHNGFIIKLNLLIQDYHSGGVFHFRIFADGVVVKDVGLKNNAGPTGERLTGGVRGWGQTWGQVHSGLWQEAEYVSEVIVEVPWHVSRTLNLTMESNDASNSMKFQVYNAWDDLDTMWTGWWYRYRQWGPRGWAYGSGWGFQAINLTVLNIPEPVADVVLSATKQTSTGFSCPFPDVLPPHVYPQRLELVPFVNSEQMVMADAHGLGMRRAQFDVTFVPVDQKASAQANFFSHTGRPQTHSVPLWSAPATAQSVSLPLGWNPLAVIPDSNLASRVEWCIVMLSEDAEPVATVDTDGAKVVAVRVSVPPSDVVQLLQVRVAGTACGLPRALRPRHVHTFVCGNALSGKTISVHRLPLAGAPPLNASIPSDALFLCEITAMRREAICSPGCNLAQAVDNSCQEACNVAKCAYDDGVCTQQVFPFDGRREDLVRFEVFPPADPVDNPYMFYRLPLPDRFFINNTQFEMAVRAITETGTGFFTPLFDATVEASLPMPPVMWQTEESKFGAFSTIMWRYPHDRGGREMYGSYLYTDPLNTGELDEENLVIDSSTSLDITSYVRKVVLGNFYLYRTMVVGEMGESEVSDLLVVQNVLPRLPMAPSPPIVHAQATGGALFIQVMNAVENGGAPVFSYTLKMKAPLAEYEVVQLYQVTDYAAPTSYYVEPGAVVSSDEEVVYSASADDGLAEYVPDDPSRVETFTLYSIYGVSLVFNTTYTFCAIANNHPGAGHPLCSTSPTFCQHLGASPCSEVLITRTSFPTPPNAPSPPALVAKTAGTMTISFTFPEDRGGVSILSFDAKATLDDQSQLIVVTCGLAMDGFPIAGFLESRTYNVQVRANNEAGDGVWSSPLSVTMAVLGPPGPPKALGTSSLSSTSIYVFWEVPFDAGGVLTPDLRYHIFLGSADLVVPTDTSQCPADNAATNCAQVAGANSELFLCCKGQVWYQRIVADIASMDGMYAQLQAEISYRLVVLSDNGFAEYSDLSNILYFTTPANTGIPPLPVMLCNADAWTSIAWQSAGDMGDLLATGSRVKVTKTSDGTVVYHDAPLFVETMEVPLEAGTAYTLSVAMLRSNDGGTTITEGGYSDPLSVTTLSTLRSVICQGRMASLESGIPTPDSTFSWTIAPNFEVISIFEGLPWAIEVKFTGFDLECDHDRLSVSAISDTGPNIPVWSGGCRRRNTFIIRADLSRNITMELRTDASFQYTGVNFSYSVIAMEPGSPGGADFPPRPAMAACPGLREQCSGSANGFCGSFGTCRCNPGYMGEDCSGQHFCGAAASVSVPELCGDLSLLRAVSPDGDDVEARLTMGDVGLQSADAGTVPKPFRTIQAALDTVDATQLVLLLPGVHTGAGNVDLTVNSQTRNFRGLRGALVTTIDCSGSNARFLTAKNGAIVNVRGLGVVNGQPSNNMGGAYWLQTSSTLNLVGSMVSDCIASSGGGLYVENSMVVMENCALSGNDATSGGAVFLKASSLSMTGTEMAENSAAIGGAFYVEGAGCTISGGGSSTLQGNMASQFGGGIAVVSGDTSISSVTIDACTAVSGAGLHISGGATASLSTCLVKGNIASADGGGLALKDASSVSLLATTVLQNNVAEAGGGAAHIDSASILTSDALSSSVGNSATQGGGVYMVAAATLLGLSMQGDSASQAGGGLFMRDGTFELSGLALSSCSSGLGGGVYVTASTVTLSDSTAASCSATNGGAMYVTGASSVMNSNSIFSGSSASVNGGCMAVWGSSTVEGTKCEDCSASSGGGVYVHLAEGSLVELKSTMVGGSVASFGGGGMCVNSTAGEARLLLYGADISNNSVVSGSSSSSNTSVGGGGGLLVWREEPVSGARLVGAGISEVPPIKPRYLLVDAVDVDIGHNSADNLGGGVYMKHTSFLFNGVNIFNNWALNGGGMALDNCTVSRNASATTHLSMSGNVATRDGGGIYSISVVQLEHVAAKMSRAARGAGGFQTAGSYLSLLDCRLELNTCEGLPGEGGGFLLQPGSLFSAVRTAFTQNGATQGGGIHAADSLLFLSDCVVEGNTATSQGGGMWVSASEVNLRNSLLQGNRATGAMAIGGAVCSYLSTMHIWRSRAISNVATKAGGGLHLTLSRVTTTHSRFERNEVMLGGGGGAMIITSNFSSTECTFSMNKVRHSVGNGGGIAAYSGSDVHVLTSALLANQAGNRGGGVFCDGSSINMTSSTADSNEGAYSSVNSDAERGGGGLFASSCTLTLQFVTLLLNRATNGHGGGLYVASGTRLDLLSSSLSSNWVGAAADGGGAKSMGSILTLTDVQLDSNVGGTGGGLALFDHSLGRFEELRIRDNTATTIAASGGGGGISVRQSLMIASKLHFESNLAARGGALYGEKEGVIILEASEMVDCQASYGGGIFLTASPKDASPSTARLTRVTLERNGDLSTTQYGGGSFVELGVLKLTDCDAHFNAARDGGVIAASVGSIVEVVKSRFYNNMVKRTGGVALVSSQETRLKLQDSHFVNNSAGTSGGVLQLMEGQIDVSLCTFEGSESENGGVACTSGATAKIRCDRSTFTSNHAFSSGGVMLVESTSAAEVTRCTLTGNTAMDSGGALAISSSSHLLLNLSSVMGGPLPPHRGVSPTGMGARMHAVNGGGISVSESMALVSHSSLTSLNSMMGGGMLVEEGSTVTVVSSLFDECSSELGGAMRVKQAVVIVLDSRFTRNVVRYDGGGMCLDLSTVTVTDSLFSQNVAIESGGAIFLGTGVTMSLLSSELDTNFAQMGGGTFLSRRSSITIHDSLIWRNVAMDNGGGSFAASRTWLTVHNSRYLQNVAKWLGGGIHADGWTKLTVAGSLFSHNVASNAGGAVSIFGNGSAHIATSILAENLAIEYGGGGLTMDDFTNLALNHSLVANNSGLQGGGVQLQGYPHATIENCNLTGNRATATDGGAVWIGGDTEVSLLRCRLQGNRAEFAGGGTYVTNVFGPHKDPPDSRSRFVVLTELTFVSNEAQVGGGFYWEVAYHEMQPIWEQALVCDSCTYQDNVGYDMATRSVSARVENWPPQMIRSGVVIMGVNETTDWIHVYVVDFYGQTVVVDNTTVCNILERACSRNLVGNITCRDDFFNRLSIREQNRLDPGKLFGSKERSIKGDLLFDFLRMKGKIGSPHDLFFTCVDDEQHVFEEVIVNSTIGPCYPGEELTSDLECRTCIQGKYSPKGEVCRPCPKGGYCVKPTHIRNQYIGVPMPLTLPGYWRFEVRGKLANDDICKAFFDPSCRGDEFMDFKGRCTKLDPEFGWTPEIQYGCDVGEEFYLCPMDDVACRGDENAIANNGLPDIPCNHGYEGKKCQYCIKGYFVSALDTCEWCSDSADPAVAVFVYTIGFCSGGAGAFILLCIYFADDRKKLLLLVFFCFRKQLNAFFDKKAAARHKAQEEALAHGDDQPVGYVSIEDDSATMPNFWFKSEKPKILLINMQVFSQFKKANVIDWPKRVSDYINAYNSTSMDILKLVAMDCLYKGNFFFSFMFMCGVPFFFFILLACIHSVGLALYTRFLSRMVKKCYRCGEPCNERIFVDVNHDHKDQDIGAGVEASVAAGAGASGKKLPLKMRKQPRTKLPINAVYHMKCTPKVFSNEEKTAMLKFNMDLFHRRIVLRLKHMTFYNKEWQLFFKLSLLAYTPLGAKILRLFNCTQIGKGYYLAADTDIPCRMDMEWGTYTIIGGIPSLIIFVMGVPVFFFYSIRYARNYGVDHLADDIRREKYMTGRSMIKAKLLKECKVYTESIGRLWVPPPNEEDEMVRLMDYLRIRNLRLSRNTSRLGFIYHHYSEHAWWYESVELVRKFAITAVLFFFAPGTILQIIMAMLTAIVFLSIHSYVGPYKAASDTSLAAYAHMQLTLTLFCGLLIKANVPWFYRTPNYQAEQEDIIAWVIILAHASMMTYGVLTFVRDRYRHVAKWKRQQAAKKAHKANMERINAVANKSKGVLGALRAQQLTAMKGGLGGGGGNVFEALAVANEPSPKKKGKGKPGAKKGAGLKKKQGTLKAVQSASVKAPKSPTKLEGKAAEEARSKSQGPKKKKKGEKKSGAEKKSDPGGKKPRSKEGGKKGDKEVKKKKKKKGDKDKKKKAPRSRDRKEDQLDAAIALVAEAGDEMGNSAEQLEAKFLADVARFEQKIQHVNGRIQEYKSALAQAEKGSDEYKTIQRRLKRKEKEGENLFVQLNECADEFERREEELRLDAISNFERAHHEHD